MHVVFCVIFCCLFLGQFTLILVPSFVRLLDLYKLGMYHKLLFIELNKKINCVI